MNESRINVDVLPQAAPLPERKTDGEDGFTLTELLITVVILGIMLAIAIPTFLSLTGGAKKSAAETDLNTAVQDESIYFTGAGLSTNYGIATAAGSTTGMAGLDNGITWMTTTGPTAAALVSAPMQASTKSVSVWTAPAQVILDTLGKDGIYYWAEIQNGKVTYATTTSGTPGAVSFTATTLP